MTTSEISQKVSETPKKRGRRPGKCARRRNRKARAILEAAAAASLQLSSQSSSQELPADDDNGGRRREDATSFAAAAAVVASASGGAAVASVPSDRGYTLEGVKVRRREERTKRRSCRHQLVTQHDGSPEAAGRYDSNQNDDDDALLHPKDECQLRSQLGFVPGNAVCVVARLSNELNTMVASQSPRNNNDCQGNETAAMASNANELSARPPLVVKLYPMVVRESYHGGKTDGRAFKGRKRGAMRVEDKKDEGSVVLGTTGGSHDDQGHPKTSKKGRNKRAWLVDSSTNTLEPANDEDTSSAPDATTSPNNQPNNQQEPPPQQQQIIEPFPTLYWLTSPLLRAYISKVEISKDHNVPKMQERLRSSPSHLRQMERAHKSYGRHRWELLTPQDRTKIIQRGWKAALDESRGVAGIRLKNERYDCVKCLHAHTAHYLAQVAEERAGREEKQEISSEAGAKDEKSATFEQEVERDDLNLVGKWTMEAVLDMIKK